LSNLLSYAEDELNRIGMTEDSPDEMNRMMRKHILHMMKEFAKEGHSGFSASYAISILTKLMDFKPLSPLTGEDSEWHNVSDYGPEPHWQNIRRSSVFKNTDGTCYDIDGKVFWEWYRDEDGKAHKTYYSGSGCSVPVIFPYTPPKEPIYEYRQSDAEPKSPPQNEQGLL
jgi:hypothetical protein